MAIATFPRTPARTMLRTAVWRKSWRIFPPIPFCWHLRMNFFDPALIVPMKHGGNGDREEEEIRFHFAGIHGWPPHNLQAVQEGPFSKSAKGLLRNEGLFQPRGGAAIACTVLPVRDYLVEKIFRSLQLIVPTWLTVAQNRDGRRT